MIFKIVHQLKNILKKDKNLINSMHKKYLNYKMDSIKIFLETISIKYLNNTPLIDFLCSLNFNKSPIKKVKVSKKYIYQ